MRSILTILLTSLVWSIVIYCFYEPKSTKEVVTEAVEVVEVAPQPTKSSKKSENKSKRTEKQVSKQTPAKSVETSTSQTTKSSTATTAPASTKSTTSTSTTTATSSTTEQSVTIDYAREIDGKWQPVEGAEHPLEITKYGVAIQYRGYTNRVKCNLSGKRLNIQYDKARCEITNENGVYYLEIYNSQEFSGKYKRVSQPRKIAMRPLDEALYAENIVGKWSPINGQEYPIEFSKYGTAIQKRSYENRVEYSLSGSSLRIQYDNARVTISEDASYYYLEIYNSEDFSGRYRKSK